MNFRKDILVTEAHRHPFLDRIGGMYLMRHRHGSAFGNNAGARWRQLFCAALMPWLMKYRNLRNLELVLLDEENEAASSLLENSDLTCTGLSPEELLQLSLFRKRRRVSAATAQLEGRRGDFMGSF